MKLNSCFFSRAVAFGASCAAGLLFSTAVWAGGLSSHPPSIQGEMMYLSAVSQPRLPDRATPTSGPWLPGVQRSFAVDAGGMRTASVAPGVGPLSVHPDEHRFREAQTSSRPYGQLTLYALPTGVALPFTGEPERGEEVSGHGVTLTTHWFSDERRGLLFQASTLSGSANFTAETVAGVLSGSASRGTRIAYGAAVIDGLPGEYQVIRALHSGQTLRMHMVAFLADDRVHTWSVTDNPAHAENQAVEIFFQGVKHIKVRKGNAPDVSGSDG